MDEKKPGVNPIETAMRERSAVEAPPPGSEMPEGVVEDAWREVEQDWHAHLPNLHETFSALSEDELSATLGNYERLLFFLSERYQFTRREAEARLRAWLEQLERTKETG